MADPAVIGYPTALAGVGTRVLESGAGDDRVALLHGAGSRADRWRPVVPGLVAAGHHVTAFDWPGHGFADKGAHLELTTPAFAEMVVDLLERTGPAALVGTSLGGHVAAWVGLHRPDLVRALVLVGPTGIVPRPATTATVLADRSRAGVRAKLELLLHDHGRIDDALVEEEWRVNTSPGAEQALDRVLDYVRHGIADHLVGDRLAATDLPTCLVWGEHDRWIDLDVGRRVAAALPRAPLHVVADAGHAPYAEQPDAFVALVTAFLSEVRTG